MSFDKNTPERAELIATRDKMLWDFVNSNHNTDDTDVARATFVFKIEMKSLLKDIKKLK